jgi:hypothetical protein
LRDEKRSDRDMGLKHPYWPDLTDDEGDALTEWQDDTCGDCIEGRCHWGGEESRQSIEAVRRGEEYPERCGCDRHETSVAARPYDRAHDTSRGTALAWRAAKASREDIG